MDSPAGSFLSSMSRCRARTKAADSGTDREYAWRVCDTHSPGELAGLLGDDMYDIDSLVVNGPVGGEDFNTMWSASLDGRLEVIDLAKAEISGDMVPEAAFFNIGEQLSPDGQWIYCLRLRRIILPESVRHIGASAFLYAINLREINFPSSLETIGRHAFSECIRLNAEPLVFPEGLREIQDFSFSNCESLTGTVVFPGSLVRIGTGAFGQSRIGGAIFHEGLESIGEAAFYGTRLTEVSLPGSCTDLSGGGQFSMCRSLKEIHVSDGPSYIPTGFAEMCLELELIDIPPSVTGIGDGAFMRCESVRQLDFPEGLESIGAHALSGLKALESIVLPSTLRFLGTSSCDSWKHVKAIYSKSPVPPACAVGSENPDRTPFGSYSADPGAGTPKFTPVFVPAGTADIYRNTPGWDYFMNFIETDDFPSGIQDTEAEGGDRWTAVYDLTGRSVREMQPGKVYIMAGRKFVFRR